MSDMYAETGILTKIQTPASEKTFEEQCEYICRREGVEYLPDCYNFWEEYIREEFPGTHIILNGVVYSRSAKLLDANAFCVVEDKGNTITYTACWYSGGTCINELLEGELE